ncbi:DegT/DnrJ/EryC1/StrS family aminotransferase [Hyphococcus sp.]|uniref:DegT/DnrJ/EryC1/StrS family aminotransferase n=1 Tax=Hyphococcus sp. TaxID=2038636 RepID=UPI002082165C|nr:MAG: aminotransferase DegT [Marinicaulis sp.]
MNSVVNLSIAGKSRVGDIAFIDLKAQQRRIRPAIEKRLQDVLDHGRYIAGPEIDELEAVLAERSGASTVIACASGTAALIIPLLARGVGPGDAVFAPAFTYNATANAILLAGATPVFVDIDQNTFNIDPVDLERRVAAVRAEGKLQPRAVIPVDLFGSPADYRAISKIAKREDLFVLSDGAQSFGGELDGKEVGGLAPATATSFFPGKALGAYGDAGAIFSMNALDRERWASIRWHGTDDARKESVRVGFNGRMDTFQAAILLEKLAIFDEEREARRRIAAEYDSRLGNIASPQTHVPGAKSGFGYYSLRVKNRDSVVKKLKHLGVPTAIYYTTPLHLMPAFSDYSPVNGLPETETVSSEIFSLPMHPYLTPEQVEYICDAVVESVAS